MNCFRAFAVRIVSMVALVSAVGLVAGSQAYAAYPEKGKTIEIIVKDAAGGSTDTQTRILAEFFKKDWEKKNGAGSVALHEQHVVRVASPGISRSVHAGGADRHARDCQPDGLGTFA